MLSRQTLKSSFCLREQVISKSRKPMKGLTGRKIKDKYAQFLSILLYQICPKNVAERTFSSEFFKDN